MTRSTILQRAEAIPDHARALPHVAVRGRYVNCDFMLEIGATAYLVRIRDGHITQFSSGPHLMPQWSFALRGDEAAWQQFWSAEPPPDYHDLFAMVKKNVLKLEGDLKIFMTNLLYFKLLLALPRTTAMVP
jgi:hypothetical protein